MKNKTLMAAAAVLLALCSSSAVAQSEQAECDRIRSAAESGRTRAIDRLGNLEGLVKDQVVNARTCLERFGDLAARQTVNVGGFDVAPIRDAIFKNACSVIQGKVSQVQGQVSSAYTQANSAYSQVTNLPQTATNAVTSGISNGAVRSVANNGLGQVTNKLPSAPSSGSVWDRLSNFFTSP